MRVRRVPLKSEIIAKVEIAFATVAAITLGLGGETPADELDLGKSEYHSSCATCHGDDGKGSGPVSTELKVPPADLTVLTKKNNEVSLRDHRWTQNNCRSRHPRHADLGQPVHA